jgi:hypothetical protein
MGKNSEPLRALVAVSSVKDAIVLQTWPEPCGPEDPWGCELEAVGSLRLDELGLGFPPVPTHGFWMWEGHLWYPGPNAEGVCEDSPSWHGTWRAATWEEVQEWLENA